MSVNLLSTSLSTRTQVLSLYKRILRLSQIWESKEASDTQSDREFINLEAKTLFKRNKSIQDPVVINDFIKEAEARIEIALHYRNPYTRPVNMPPKALARRQGKEQGSAQEKLKKQARPLYVKSIDQSSSEKN